MTDQSTLVKDLRTARERGESPTAPGADLRDADLHGANLHGAYLYGAYLYSADLRYADLQFANLRGADLRYADLRGADLRYADLRDADLRDADLRDADLHGATWGGLSIEGLPSGRLLLIPTSEGWRLVVGCWEGSMGALAELITQDEDWPEAEGEEIQRRRPLLEAALTLCEVYMSDRAHVIEGLRKEWGNE